MDSMYESEVHSSEIKLKWKFVGGVAVTSRHEST